MKKSEVKRKLRVPGVDVRTILKWGFVLGV